MKGKTILLVEDSPQVLKNNATALKMCGAAVLQATNLAEARRHIHGQVPDAVVLDIMLPDGSGLDLLRELRTNGAHDIPVLLLTARGESEDIVTGLKMGADDYLAKPYDLNVFEARVAALLRRSAHLPDALHCGGLTLDIASNSARCGDMDLHLTQKEFALLLLLAQNPRNPLTADYLYEKAWGEPPLPDNSAALRIQMSNLKKKLAAATEDVIIESSRREGYCLTVL